MAKITVSYLRDLEKKCDKGEISFSRMVELLNERAFDASGEKTHIHDAWAKFQMQILKPTPPKETRVAVVAPTYADFEKYVMGIYEALPTDKSMVTADYRNYITIESPQGVGTKYFHVNDVESFAGKAFDRAVLPAWVCDARCFELAELLIDRMKTFDAHTGDASRNEGEYKALILKPKRIDVPWPKTAYWVYAPDWALARGVDAMGRCIFIGIEPNKLFGGFTIKQEECGHIPILKYSQWEQSLELHPSL